MEREISKKQNAFYIFLSTIVGLLIWQLVAMAFNTLVSGPLDVWLVLKEGLENGSYSQHFLTSLYRVLTGLFSGAICAIVLGMILGWYKYPRLLMDPWIQFIRMVPPIALVPLVVVYLGVDEISKIFVIFLAAFLYMLVTIYQGIRQIDATLIKAARVLGANDLTLFFRVILPASTPHIFTAFRLGLGASWTTLVAAELFAASKGLGYLIVRSSNYYEMDKVYLGIVSIGFIGLLMDRFVQYLEKKFTAWQEKVK